MNRVPLATPTRLSESERAAVEEALQRVARSSRWILGPEVEQFEEEFAAFVGAESAVGVGNGTDALALAFLALEIPLGSDVLVSASDGGYSAVAARMVGLNPIVMDLDPTSLEPSVATAAAALTSNARALVLTHLHGNALALDELEAWRQSKGLLLVEDCAQAHGLVVDGNHVGSVGDAATYSFYPTKNLGALGDAGAVTFPRRTDVHGLEDVEGSEVSEAAARARSLRQYGWSERYFSALSGGRNSRMDEIQAAVLRARLPELGERNERRRSILHRYSDILAEGTRATVIGADGPSVAHHAVVLTATLTERESLHDHLNSRGIDSTVHYPWLVSEMPGLHPEPLPGGFPVAADRRDRILSVPCTPELTDVEVTRVENALREWSSR